MKKIIIPILLLSLSNCNKNTTKPIVDYSTNYEDNRGLLDVSYSNEKLNQQTVALIDNKEYSLDEFKKLVKKNRIEVQKITKDSLEIKKLNYSNKTIKTVIFAKKLI